MSKHDEIYNDYNKIILNQIFCWKQKDDVSLPPSNVSANHMSRDLLETFILIHVALEHVGPDT